jgi:hypothetical protein
MQLKTFLKKKWQKPTLITIDILTITKGDIPGYIGDGGLPDAGS